MPKGSSAFVPPFYSVLVFIFSSRPPATMVACGRILTLVSLATAPAFSFNSSFFVSPPPPLAVYAGGFEGGLSYYSAFFVSPPPATLTVRGRVLTVGCLIIVSAFLSITFLRVFPGFIAKPFRGVGVSFEKPHLRLVF